MSAKTETKKKAKRKSTKRGAKRKTRVKAPSFFAVQNKLASGMRVAFEETFLTPEAARQIREGRAAARAAAHAMASVKGEAPDEKAVRAVGRTMNAQIDREEGRSPKATKKKRKGPTRLQKMREELKTTKAKLKDAERRARAA